MNVPGSSLKLYSCFVELRKTKPTEKITVKELCEKAHVNRSTFYRSYYDIYDIEEKIADYCIKTIVSFCSELNFGLADGILEGTMLSVSKFSDSFVIDFILSEGRNPLFIQKMFDAILEAASAFIFPDKLGEEYTRVKNALCFILSGAVGLCSDLTITAVSEEFYEVAAISVFLFKKVIEFAKSGSWPQVPISESGEVELRQKKERLNVMKTKRSLKRTFIGLLERKSFDEITVSELCEKAEICNSTFYVHFNSLDSFIDSVKDDILNSFLSITKGIFAAIGKEKLPLGTLVSYIKIAQKLFALLSKKNDGVKKLLITPADYAKRFYPLVQKDYCSEFDGELAFKLICYAGWIELFRPLCETGETQMEIMTHAYLAFTTLFKRKEKTSGD